MRNHLSLNLLLLFALLLSACGPSASTSNLTQSGLATREALLNATVAALNATLTPTITLSPTASLTPTITPTPTQTLTPTITPTPTPDAGAFSHAARILLHEDIVQSEGLAEPYVRKALEAGGYDYETTGGNIGTLKDMLKQHWDLVIIAAEMKANLQGEFFTLMNKHLYDGGALVLETWLLDKIAANEFQYLLASCGLEVAGDFPASIDRGVYWTDPAHPLLNSPNAGINLNDFVKFWEGDLGDLLKPGPGGDGQIIGSTTGSKVSDGVLASCLGGRFILQTFSTHDHPEADMVPLWENYIAYALSSLYEQRMAQQNLPIDPLKAFKDQANIVAYKPPHFKVANYTVTLPYLEVLTLGSVEVTAAINNSNLQRGLVQEDLDLIVMSELDEPYIFDTLTPLLDALWRGSSVVIQLPTLVQTGATWNVQALKNLMDACGVEYAGKYNASMLLPETWLLPDHPLAQTAIPKRVRTADQMGGLLKLLPGSKAELVGGVMLDGEPAGFLVSCFEGRMVWLTINSAQYDPWDMFQLWENSMDYALQNRMAYLASLPTPTPTPKP